MDVSKEVSKFARQTATTFAPRPSGASKNPAYKGMLPALHHVFVYSELGPDYVGVAAKAP